MVFIDKIFFANIIVLLQHKSIDLCCNKLFIYGALAPAPPCGDPYIKTIYDK